jgi:hypothetical protein
MVCDRTTTPAIAHAGFTYVPGSGQIEYCVGDFSAEILGVKEFVFFSATTLKRQRKPYWVEKR